ncbi:sperm-associated antigen 8 isoform X1 [Peromyscus eremicus]|uniref:sperm-associated antigen 8 isoform X1 n=1 Tax=Peromyscus eremicus TaxID=42410 RepID=UPI0027DD88FB|nr:sperm-associated antigen 8 isoform X1 [Peromyscus eremicus]
METTESTEESRSRSLEVQPSSEGLETTSEPIPSSGASPRSALEAKTVPAVLCKEAHGPYSVLTEPSSDSLPEASCPRSHQIGHGSFGYQPLYVSYIPRNPCATDPSSSPVAASSYPGHSSGHSSCPGSGSGSGVGQSSDTGQGSRGPTSGPGPATGPALAHGPGLASGPGPADSGPGHKFSSSVPQGFRNPPPDPLPYSSTWEQYYCCVPCHQGWEPLQVSEPGVRGTWKPPEVERKSEFLCKTRPRGQCLLYNWDEERATNHLDQIPRSQDGSESYFFRHGHQGLLSVQPRSPMPSSTTQTDSYQPPRNICQPLRGKREAMLEMFLHHQICEEVRAEQEPPRKLFEAESVTHHDYRAKLVQTGPPAPTKPHDYRQEQPETFWIQRAPLLPGVSNIRTLDTPFRKNCSFSTPVPLSLGQPLPYELESFPHQMGVMSSLSCQGGGQGCGGPRTTPA